MKYDQHENCAKCGYPGKTTTYEKEYWATEGLGQTLSERLHLTCSRCGYQWFRDCLDKEEV